MAKYERLTTSIKAQLALDQQHEQERVERVFRDIELLERYAPSLEAARLELERRNNV